MNNPVASYRNPLADPERVVAVTEQPDGRWTVVTETKWWRYTRRGCRTRPDVGDEIAAWRKGSWVSGFRVMIRRPSLWDGHDDD